jgi:IclR family transcriptional regulator, KDG regulon repressor
MWNALRVAIMNNTLRYGFDILEFLADRGSDCSTSELARELDLSKSQTSRILKTLTEIGYVSQNLENKQYSINLSILKLSHNYLAKMKQRHVIRPYMQELVDKFEQGCFSSVPVGLEAIVSDVIYPRSLASSAAVIAEIGAVNNPYTTASGKICAAYLNSEEIEKLLNDKPPKHYTAKTLVDKDALLIEYAKIKKHRLARSQSERRDGENSISAPIFDRNEQLIATIGMALPDGEQSKDLWNEYQNAIIRAANGASFALGYPLR